MSHGIVKCVKCKDIIRQCRCGEHTQISWEFCGKCDIREQCFVNNFDKALDQVFFVEGGYSDHPKDKGGKTMYGITEAAYQAWIKSKYESEHWPALGYLTKEMASKIYQEMYWNAVRGDELPRGVSLMVFDSAVHAGPTKAIKWLQRAVGERSDGILGPKTLQAATRSNRSSSLREPLIIVKKIAEYRLLMARTNETFVRGWFSRIVHILGASIEEVMAGFYLSPR